MNEKPTALDKSENHESRKVYIKPSIGEEITLPTAVAANGYLTPVYAE